jgi:hypothetical protein
MKKAMKLMKTVTFSLGIAVFPPVIAQMQPAPAPVGQAQLVEVTTTVEGIDLGKRLITVKGPHGRVVTWQVGPAVKNLDRIKVGDKVHVKYYRAALETAQKLGPEAERGGKVTESATVTGALGGMPAGAKAREVRQTVEILDVDPYKKAIAFRDMNGKFREVSVDSPHLMHWLHDLKKGDKVRVAYVDAIVIMVEPE